VLVSLISRLAALLLAAAVLLMAVQVVLRFAFNAPQAWAEEVDRYLFVWSVYLGAFIALTKGTHIRVGFLVDALGPRADAVSQGLGRIVNLFCFSFVAYYGYRLAYDNRHSKFYTLEFMPQILFYLAVPVCLSLMALFLVWPRRPKA
jgi:TRAP-type transport system small permease protein